MISYDLQNKALKQEWPNFYAKPTPNFVRSKNNTLRLFGFEWDYSAEGKIRLYDKNSHRVSATEAFTFIDAQ